MNIPTKKTASKANKKKTQKYGPISKALNLVLYATISSIWTYLYECKEKIEKYALEEDAHYFSSYARQVLTNVIEMINRTVFLYDNKKTIIGVIFHRIITPRLNKKLKEGIDEILLCATEFRDYPKLIESDHITDPVEKERYILLEIINCLSYTTDDALSDGIDVLSDKRWTDGYDI